jgi:hypothetical protein
MTAPELKRVFKRYDRKVERDLRRDRKRLFKALEDFANIRQDKQGWSHFRLVWPTFFPQDEYDRVAADEKPNVFDYPYWLNQIWVGGETNPYLDILLGTYSAPEIGEVSTLEDSWLSGLGSMPPEECHANWDEGVFRYQGGCDFQRALYLLFRESWRAKVCEQCRMKFIARRSGQKYCSTECSGQMQRELKRKWWSEHGETWREKRKTLRSKKRGGVNGTRKTR